MFAGGGGVGGGEGDKHPSATRTERMNEKKKMIIKYLNYINSNQNDMQDIFSFPFSNFLGGFLIEIERELFSTKNILGVTNSRIYFSENFTSSI